MSSGADKHPESVPELLASLRALASSKEKAVRRTVHIYPAALYAGAGGADTHGDSHPLDTESDGQGSSTGHARDRRITSWKMKEHLYFNANNPFPTLARGLFTEEVQEEGDGDEVQERIVARGYDKFFNVGEVAWTEWEAMERYTQAPYHLTLKSNGCLILISALSPDHVMVASKHSLGTKTEAELESNSAPQMDKLAIEESEVGAAATGPGRNAAATHVTEPPVDEEKQDRAHAEVGREWLRRTLAASGKTEAELAKRLWDANLSAVLELCDDSFEEHVIATPEHWTGLHLHGLNHNTPHFSTLPPAEVTSFAHEFGFIPTKTVQLDTLAAVREYTDDKARTGSWDGDMIEGFVVRSAVRVPPADENASTAGRPPYRPGAPFFSKVKFDEPYLLYRQWREVTRTLLPLLDLEAGSDRAVEVWRQAEKKCRRPEVALYADWVGEEMVRDPGLFADYARGVVRVRERFLEWTRGAGAADWEEASAGKYRLKNAPGRAAALAKKQRSKGKGKEVGSGQKGGKGREEEPRDKSTLPKKWIVVPMAIPGTGKTLVGLVLSDLLGWGHTQSDDVTSKRSSPTFLKNIAALLGKYDVVYADRNNHIDKHYDELRELADGGSGLDKVTKGLAQYNIQLIGLRWDVKDHPYQRVLRICSERVVSRGDNHATLRPDSTGHAEHEAIVGKFLRDFTEPNDSTFDALITVPILDTPLAAIEKIIASLPRDMPTGGDAVESSPPSPERIATALDKAKGHRCTTPYHPPDRHGRAVRYYGLAPEIDLEAVVEIGVYYMPPELAQRCQRFLARLQRDGRIVERPHVTLSHENNVALEEGRDLDQEKEERARAKELKGKVAEDKQESSTKPAVIPSKATAPPHAVPGSPGPQRIAWELCKRLAGDQSALWTYDVTHIAWDDRVMALILDDLRLAPLTSTDHDRASLTAEEEAAVVLPDVREALHITVGTVDDKVRPFESRGVVKVAKEGIARGEGDGTGVEAVEGGGEVRWAQVGRVAGEGRIRGLW